MNSDRIRLFTLLTPSECASRLKIAIDTDWRLFGSKPVVGKVTESSLCLRKRIGYRNSFQSVLTATMQREAGDTVLSGKVAMGSFVRAFMFIWFGGLLLIGGTIFVVAIASMISGSSNRQHDAWLGLVVPPAMLVFGYGLVRFGRYLARDEARFLTDFLIQTLDARETNHPGSSVDGNDNR